MLFVFFYVAKNTERYLVHNVGLGDYYARFGVAENEQRVAGLYAERVARFFGNDYLTLSPTFTVPKIYLPLGIPRMCFPEAIVTSEKVILFQQV